MKIAMIGHKRAPSREGGIEIVVGELAVRMAAMGHDVTLYNRKGNNVAGAQFNSDASVQNYKGVRIKSVPTIDLRGAAALTASAFAVREAVNDSPDIIHFHAEGPCAAIPYARKHGVKTIATIHGLDWQRAKWGKFASAYLKHCEKVAAKNADELIVLSKNVQDYFRQKYERNTVYIPNGVDVPKRHEACVIKDRFDIDKNNYLLYLGRIVPEKGVHYLIEAFKGVRTNKKLVIAGGSSDSTDYYKAVRELGNSDSRVIFTDFVEGDTLKELYSNAYLYILPSDLEGMPMSLLEAMSYGLCCVTSDIPECIEVTQNFELSFEKGNVNSLSTILQKLLDNQNLTIENAAKSFERVSRNHCWDEVTQKTLALYQEVIKRNG